MVSSVGDYLLDPELMRDIREIAKSIDHLETEAGNDKLAIALRVNDMESEHASTFGSRMEYLAECSRIANLETKRKIFAESGETLRQWCDLAKLYKPFCDKKKIEMSLLLEEVTFDHLRKARKIYMDGLVKSPLEALSRASTEQWSADDMEYHYSANRTGMKVSFINYLTQFVSKKLEKMELPKEKAERAKVLIAELQELFR